jgi:hypothetical protein
MLRVPEVAELLGTPENSFHEVLGSKNHPPFYKIYGSKNRQGIRIDAEDLAIYLESVLIAADVPEAKVDLAPQPIQQPDVPPVIEESSDVDLSVVVEPPVPVSAELEEEEVEDDDPDAKYAEMSIIELRALTNDQLALDEIFRRKQLLKR